MIKIERTFTAEDAFWFCDYTRREAQRIGERDGWESDSYKAECVRFSEQSYMMYALTGVHYWPMLDEKRKRGEIDD